MTRLVIFYALVRGVLRALSDVPIPSASTEHFAVYKGAEAERAFKRMARDREWWFRECEAGRRSWKEYPYAY